MGINILKEISDRARKIEYISTESNKEINFKDLFNDSIGNQGIEDPKINEISNGIGAILEIMNSTTEKVNENPSNEFDVLLKSIISTYDYIRDRKELPGTESVETSAAIEDILKRLENDLKKSGVSLQNPINKQFDPDLYEKGGSDKNPDLEENTITKVLKCGVIYKDHIIRKAKVAVVQNKKRSRDKQE